MLQTTHNATLAVGFPYPEATDLTKPSPESEAPGRLTGFTADTTPRSGQLRPLLPRDRFPSLLRENSARGRDGKRENEI